MPNHVTHRMDIAGDPDMLTRLIEAHVVTDAEDRSCLDFQTLVPMPAILERTESGASTEMGRHLLGLTAKYGELFGIDPWRDPLCILAGHLSHRAEREAGSTDWYDWCVKNWGTKWNSYNGRLEDAGEGGATLIFDAAWSVPEPVFEKIAELWPELEFQIAAFDEGWNFAYSGQIVDGLFAGDSCEASDEMYEAVYGHPPEREEEDQ